MSDSAPTGRRTGPTAAEIEAMPEVLTREQAARLLQLTPGRLSEAAKRGDIPSTVIGRGRRYSKSALLRFVRGD